MPSRPGSSSSSRDQNQNGANNIKKLDYKPGGRPLLHREPSETPRRLSFDTPRDNSEERSLAGSFFSDVAEGIAEQDRNHMKRQFTRYFAFSWALINTLGAGGITAYSLYGPLFQTRLHYSQLMVNGVSITGMLSLYLPVPIWGIISDRSGPGLPSLLSGIMFGFGYILAALTYQSGAPVSRGGDGWPYWVMIVSFIFIGSGTSCMYLSAIVTCAKNFGRGKFRGFAMACPIACFGLSGMWQSQVGSNLLYERNPDGSKGDVDVPRYFLFLALYLLTVGCIGFFALRVVDENEFINEAVDELEQSGLIEDSEVFSRLMSTRQTDYGTDGDVIRRLSTDEIEDIRRQAEEEEKARRLEQQLKKEWLLNEETRRFLADKNMWFLLVGFFLVSGPGESFVNNLGTVIGTLYPPPDALSGGGSSKHTTAATHVSITAITSTIARILTGTLTDLLAPSTVPHQHRRGPNSLANSMASLAPPPPKRFEISRIAFLISFSFVMSLGQIVLASGVVQGRGDLFWIVSVLVGFGYGAIFSLTPICVSVIWGVENFGTNWGIVATAPAFGATVYGLLYSTVYQKAAEANAPPGEPLDEDALCYGSACYAPTFWIMAFSVWIACGLWMFAWRGPGGWIRREIAV